MTRKSTSFPSYQAERFKTLAENVQQMLKDAKAHPSRPQRRRTINAIGDFVEVACWANDPKRILRLEQEENMRRALEEIKQTKQAHKKAMAKQKAEKAKLAEQKVSKRAPILTLFKKEKVWPPIVAEGKRAPKEPPLKMYQDFINEYGLKDTVPTITGKQLSKANLVLFFIELCRQLQVLMMCTSAEVLRACTVTICLLADLGRAR